MARQRKGRKKPPTESGTHIDSTTSEAGPIPPLETAEESPTGPLYLGLVDPGLFAPVFRAELGPDGRPILGPDGEPSYVCIRDGEPERSIGVYGRTPEEFEAMRAGVKVGITQGRKRATQVYQKGPRNKATRHEQRLEIIRKDIKLRMTNEQIFKHLSEDHLDLVLKGKAKVKASTVYREANRLRRAAQ